MKWMGIFSFLAAGGFYLAGFYVFYQIDNSEPWFTVFAATFVFIGTLTCIISSRLSKLEKEIAQLKNPPEDSRQQQNEH